MGDDRREAGELNPHASQRRPEIELLRVVALVAVFAAHAAQPFNPWDVWQLRGPESSKWLGELVLFVAPWVMPLFVLLAGASAWHSLGARSTAEYLNERVMRLILPMAVGILLVVPPQVYYGRRQ
jgi:fucose 4-O-acetylase-like acetyltransferase